jgi:hypothetical protein
MNDRLNPIIGRRQVVRTLTGAAAVAVAGLPPAANAASATEAKKPSGKARYQADSAEVQTFYRVNRYPKK